MSLTAPLIAGALKLETSAPVVALMRATLFALTPLTFAMRPPMYTVPSPASTMSNTSFVPTFGVKAVSTAPVVALNAKMLLRVNVAPPADAAAVTDVNLPTAMIRLPIWTIASTLPWLTLGVKFAGSAETMWSMVGSDADAPRTVPNRLNPSTAAAAAAETRFKLVSMVVLIAEGSDREARLLESVSSVLRPPGEVLVVARIARTGHPGWSRAMGQPPTVRQIVLSDRQIVTS